MSNGIIGFERLNHVNIIKGCRGRDAIMWKLRDLRKVTKEKTDYIQVYQPG